MSHICKTHVNQMSQDEADILFKTQLLQEMEARARKRDEEKYIEDSDGDWTF